jgi:hypothetical protein
MANYKELEGFGVQTLATDPDTPGWIGSIFYNSTSGTFKTVKPGGAPAGTWASGGTMNVTRGNDGASGGTSVNDAIVTTGYTGTALSLSAETYDGSAWTVYSKYKYRQRLKLKDQHLVVQLRLYFVVEILPPITGVTESWNGSSWTEVNDLNTARETIWRSRYSNSSFRIWWRNSSTCTGAYRILEWHKLDGSK